jgi:sulfoxide reductase heme-binding subunit YedZ
MSLNMSTKLPARAKKKSLSLDWIVFPFLGLLAALAALLLATPGMAPLRAAIDRLFAFNTQQATWYVTRAAGLITYLLLWLSTAWGLAIPSKLFSDVLNGEFAFDFHQFISLISLAFLGLHVFILTGDRFLPYSLAQVLIPFQSPYRPVWVGIGSLAFYLTLLVTVTFYLRKRIGMKTFRTIHYTSLLAYLLAVVHALQSGTDSARPLFQVMYAGTFLVVVFLVVYWLVAMRLHPKPGDS